MKRVLYFLSILLITSCSKSYKETITICDKKIFVEKYQTSLIDETTDYLTDSIKFRLKVGIMDNEHNFYYYLCRNDSIFIQLLSRDSDSLGNRKVIEQKIYSIKELEAKYKL